MRYKSCFKHRLTRLAPPPGLSSRYAAFGMLVVMSACTTAQSPSQYTTHFSRGVVRGFQIQIHSTQDKTAAEEVVAAAEVWWQSIPDSEQRTLFGVGFLPVEIKQLAPYYRVRIGHFRTRDDARAILDKVAAQFPAAFVVPDRML
ncbi:MAG: SPOR domain-containing protein [Rhodothermales bacterium]